MTPSYTDTAAVLPPKQSRRPASRIVPAIPHRYTKRPAAVAPVAPEKPVPPESTDPEPATSSAADGEAKSHDTEQRAITPAPSQEAREQQSAAIATPDADQPEYANSPARSGDIEAESVTNLQNGEINSQESSLPVSLPLETPESMAAPRVNGTNELPPEFHPLVKPSPQQNSGRFEEDTTLSGPKDGLHRSNSSLDGTGVGDAVQQPPSIPTTLQDSSVQQQHFARPPPGLTPPHLAPQFFPGHSHHPSDSTPSWPQALAIAPLVEPAYTNGHGHQSPTQPNGPGTYQALPYAPFIPSADAPGALNGDATPQSRSPNKAHFEDPHLLAMYDSSHQSAHYSNGNVSHPLEAMHEGYDMAQHVFHLLGNPEFTDFILHVRTKDTLLLSLPVHAAIVSRSPVIMAGLRRSASPAYRSKDSRRLVDVLANDKFITSESLHEGIKILYAAPLLSAQSFLFGLLPYDGAGSHDYITHEARRRMTQALSYAAAGRVFQIAEMQACGLRIAKALLRWDTIDQALHFGLSAGATTVQPSGAAADNRLLEAYAVPLLDEAIEFLAYSFPSDFSLYVLAPEMRQCPRLPTFAQAKTPAHNPRLSKIRFGDAPPEEDSKPNSISQVLSSILLSLPLHLLDRLLGHPAAANRAGWSGLVKIMQDVVEERELRRQKALAAYGSSGREKPLPRSLLDNLHRSEKVESTADRPSGYMLTATR